MGKLLSTITARDLAQGLAIALLYFAGVAFSCLISRADGGVALIWVASPILASRLAVTNRTGWIVALAFCAIAHEIAAGVFGLGWAVGPWLALANLSEAAAAALLTRYTLRTHWPIATFEMVSVFLLGTALVIPAFGALFAATAAHWILGAPLVTTFHHWMLGHAVGLVAMMPFGLSLASRLSPRPIIGERVCQPMDKGRILVSVLTVATMVLLILCVFIHEIRWPLVTPLLFALFAAIWADALVATAMPMLVMLIAAPLTLAGIGPMAPGLALPSDRLLLGLVYAGLVACCTLPLVVEQARRRQQIAQLRRSAEHFQAMSERADGLIDELRRAALTDPLTGLPNRRAFFDSLTQQATSSEPACLAMIDIDHFKKVNDRHGHATGDTVLRHFADLARSSFRGSDMVARIGGEEFAVILRGVTLDQACHICQRLVDRLANTRIATDVGPVRVTISSGIAAILGDGHAAMIGADLALYEAKRAGRSRLSAAA
jgi:diguanylate cyclase (GGDEF)-like protein